MAVDFEDIQIKERDNDHIEPAGDGSKWIIVTYIFDTTPTREWADWFKKFHHQRQQLILHSMSYLDSKPPQQLVSIEGRYYREKCRNTPSEIEGSYRKNLDDVLKQTNHKYREILQQREQARELELAKQKQVDEDIQKTRDELKKL